MKKEYIAPDIEIIYFDTEDIICESGSVPSNDTPDTLTTIGVDTGDAGSTANPASMSSGSDSVPLI